MALAGPSTIPQGAGVDPDPWVELRKRGERWLFHVGGAPSGTELIAIYRVMAGVDGADPGVSTLTERR